VYRPDAMPVELDDMLSHHFDSDESLRGKEHIMDIKSPRGRRPRWALLMLGLVLALSVLTPAPLFAQNEAPAARHGAGEWSQIYVVRRGDTLAQIARRFGVTVLSLMQANHIPNPNRLEVGQRLFIPDRVQGQPSSPVVPVVPSNPPVCTVTYTVRSGDTLSGIALYYGVDPDQLAHVNGIRNQNRVYVGQVLCIPVSVRPPVVQPPYNPGPQHPPYNPGPHQPSHPGPQQPPHPPHPTPQHPQPAPQGDEYWQGSYYKDKYFTEFAETRQDKKLYFNWYLGGPFGDGGPVNRFSVRWEKNEFFRGGWYRFTATADDGVRVYVDGQMVINGWLIQPATDYSVELYLKEGLHGLKVEYYEESEDAMVRVDWEPIKK
jgi:LysM repeat protein